MTPTQEQQLDNARQELATTRAAALRAYDEYLKQNQRPGEASGKYRKAFRRAYPRAERGEE